MNNTGNESYDIQPLTVRENDYLLNREQFMWRTNPLVSLAREAIHSELLGIDKNEKLAFNELDIVMQSMLSLCYYKPFDVWEGDTKSIQNTIESIEQNSANNPGNILSNLLEQGMARPNIDLLRPIVKKHYKNQIEVIGGVMTKGFHNYISSHASPFGVEAFATTKGRQFYPQQDGTITMQIKEKHSDKKITMKRVDLNTSQRYAQELHYVHKAREDEIVAFGAYTDDSELPFAWVSYSPIGSEAERIIANNAGLDPNTTIEMTRAWNTLWSPKNTMSILFSYAHTQIQGMNKKNALTGYEDELGGVITAINPNLGFSGMAFKGVDFGVVGLKPTNHKYIIEDGVPIYMLRRDIASRLHTTVDRLKTYDEYGESSMPLLPTNVMAVIFDGSARNKPVTPVYVVTQ